MPKEMGGAIDRTCHRRAGVGSGEGWSEELLFFSLNSSLYMQTFDYFLKNDNCMVQLEEISLDGNILLQNSFYQRF